MNKVFLIMASLLIFLVCDDRTLNLYDESIILEGAVRVTQGAVIHRDFYFLYGPGSPYAVALLFKIFSPSVFVERAWDASTRCLVVLFMFLLVERVASRSFAWLAATGSIIWLANLGFYGYPIFPALAFGLASEFFLVPVFNGSRSIVALAASGFCAGFTTLFRYDVGLALFFVEGCILGFYAFYLMLERNIRIGRGLQMLSVFCAGMTLIVLPLLGAYLFFGIMPDFIRDVFMFPEQSYVKMRSLPFPREGFRSGLGTFAVYLPLLVSALAAISIVGAASRSKLDRSSFWTILLMVCVTLVFFAKGAVRVSVIHMAMAIISSLAVMAVLLYRPHNNGPLVRVTQGVGTLVAVLFTLVELHGAFHNAEQNIAWLAHGATCGPTEGIGRLGCFEIDQQHLQAIQYIQRKTPEGSELFVGLGRHDKILLNDIAFYFLAKRTPATKWYEFDPGVQTTAPVQSEIVSELRNQCPDYVVLESQWDNIHEPNGSALSSGVTILDSYINQNYSPVKSFGSILILRHISSITSTACVP